MQFSNVGAAVTSGRNGDVKARTALFVRRAVEWIASGFGELVHDRVEHGLPRPERILIAADLDFLDALRRSRTRRASATLASGAAALASGATCAAAATGLRLALLSLRLVVFVTARRQKRTHRRAFIIGADDPQEPAA